MDVLVRLDDSEELEDFLARASWYGVDGLEIDLSSLDDESYGEVVQAVEEEGFPVRSVHYGGTSRIPLQDWEGFDKELSRVLERADEMGAESVSVSPPGAGSSESNTVRDFQRFVEKVEGKAEEASLEICFLLEGFMKDSDVLDSALERLEESEIGVMVDIDRIPEGINPEVVLENVEVPVWKVLVPMTVQETRESLEDVEAEVLAVAEFLD